MTAPPRDLTEVHSLLPQPVQDAVDPAEIGADTGWAEIGLSSMQLIEFVTAVEDHYALEFSAEDFLSLPTATFGDLLSLVDARRGAEGGHG